MSNYFKTVSDKKKGKRSDDPFATNIDSCHKKDDKKALANYTTWLRERHAVHQKIGKKLNRQSGELLMNVGDESNMLNEEKRALEYTRIPQKFDKYRGNPEWWEFPPGLHDKCSNRRDKVTYFYQKTDVQKNEIPEIEKVGVPGFVKVEKMLYPRTRSVYNRWQDLDYRKSRVEELSSLLVNIEPHKPDFDRLIVMGKNIHSLPAETQTLSHLSDSSTIRIKNARRKTSVYDSSLKCCLKINGVFFYENSQSLSTSRKFHVLFEYDVQSLPFQTQYIVFENVGRITIRLTWKKMEKFRLFRDIAEVNDTEFFCFDKNMLILVPGQIVNFPIWFQTNKVCTVVETWEITTVPTFWSEPIRVFFVLQAQTHIENFMMRMRKIKANISKRVKKRIIKEILEDIMKKSKYQDYKSINYSYYEPELFEAMNFDDSHPIRKPKYQYDKEIVGQLKKFYAEVRQSYHPKTWNLNVWDLQVLSRVKDLIEYAEIRTAEYSQYRAMIASRSTLMDDQKKYSSSEIKLKHKSIDSGMGDQSDPFLLKETRYGQLMKLLWKMAPPSISLNQERLKYFQVYSIFNAYFALMSMELHLIKPFNSNITEFEHTFENCPRLIFEKFDEIQLDRTKRSFQEDTTAQPKPEILRDISSTDVQRVHNLYFLSTSSEYVLGKTIPKSDKIDKKKSKQEDRLSKGKPSQAQSNLSRTTLEEMGLVNFDFDPYEDIPAYPKDNVSLKRPSVLSQNSLRISIEGIEIEDSKINTLNTYVIIFNYLSEAVDAMVDTLESAKEYRVPHENIEQLKACFKLFIDDEAPESEDRPVNPFKNADDRDYFEKILKAHLNEVTGQYLICGKTEPVAIQRQSVSYWGRERELVHEPKAPSVFSLFKPVPEEVRYEERGAQTQHADVCEVEAVSFSSREICECPSEYRLSPEPPTDMFYYSEDEEFDGLDVPRKDRSLVRDKDSDDEVVSEVPKNKASVSRRASISLIKEWNKKKCSRDELE